MWEDAHYPPTQEGEGLLGQRPHAPHPVQTGASCIPDQADGGASG